MMGEEEEASSSSSSLRLLREKIVVFSEDEAADPRLEVYRDIKDRDVAGRGEFFILEGANSIQNLVN